MLALRAAALHAAVGSRLQFLDAGAVMARSAGELQAISDHLSELEHEAASHRADRLAYQEGWRRDVLENLAARRAALGETQAALDRALHVQSLINITAPEDGIALMKKRTTVFKERQGTTDKKDRRVQFEHFLRDWSPPKLFPITRRFNPFR